MRIRTEIPPNLKKYGESPVFNETTVPIKLTTVHDTKPGVWGRLMVYSGALKFIVPGPPQMSKHITNENYVVIEPTVPHRVEIDGSVQFKIEFFK